MGKSNSKFTIDDIPDLKGKIAVVTGGNTGIGFAISKALAFKGAHVVIASRNQLKLDKAAEELTNYIIKLNQAKPQISTFLVDLSSFTSIKSFANDLTSKFDRIDILINNAGILMNPYSKTEQGFELTLGTNGIGTAYLTNLLLPLVIKSNDGRIVMLSSSFINFVNTNKINKALNDIGYKNNESTDFFYHYPLSKYYNTAYAEILQEKLLLKGINNVTVISVHPGVIKTEIFTKASRSLIVFIFESILVPMIRKSPEEGAISTLFSATSPNAYRYRGKMLDEGPYIKPLDITTSAYTLENANKVFDEINKAIVLAGFEGLKL